ncbi:MAG: hypothetical protein ABSD70_05140 [Terracidiphilus sp.]
MPTSLEGVGFNMLGCRDLRPDGSFVTTKFFCLLYVPIVPISSWRVIPSRRNPWLPFVRKRYQRAAKQPLNLPQVISVYLAAAAIVGYGICFFEFAVPWLKTHSNLIDDSWVEVLVFAIWMSLPWFLIRRMRQRAVERVRENIHDLNTPKPIF